MTGIDTTMTNDMGQIEPNALKAHKKCKAIISQNLRSGKANGSKLKELIVEENISICIIQETWGHCVKIKDYCTISSHRKGKKGGGLSIIARNQDELKMLHTNQTHDLEYMIGETTSMNILNIYRPPSGSIANFFLELTTALKLIRVNNKITIAGGDVNIDLSTHCWQAGKLKNTMLDYNLISHTNSSSRVTKNSSTQIDALFTNGTKLDGVGTLITSISDHLTPFIKLKFKNKPQHPETVKCRDLSKKAITSLKQALKTEPIIIESQQADAAYIEFMTKFNTLFDKHCKKTEKKFDLKFNKMEPWYTDGLLVSRKTKIKLHKQFLKSRTEINEIKYKSYLKTYNTLTRKAKRDYCADYFRKNSGNGRKIWSYANEMLDRTKAKEPLTKEFMGNNKEKIMGDKNIANLLNSHFTSVGPKLASHMPISNKFKEYLNQKHNKTLTLRELPPETIKKFIDGMESKKSSSFDEISNHLLKELKMELLLPITNIINLSIKQGIFPETLKIAKIVPLFKSGEKNEANNYRPISLLPVLSKLYEKSIYSQLSEYFEEHFLTKYQYGFRSKRETSHCILNYLNNIYANSASKWHVAIFIDLRKAFDTVPHDILLHKLKYYGLDEIAIKWLTCYLTNRQQSTDVNGIFSDLEYILCGVPQGSILGPLLFLIFINDLPNSTAFLINLFADDTTLQYHGSNIRSLETEVNKHIITIMNWFKENRLSIHPQKTYCMVYKLWSNRGDQKTNDIDLWVKSRSSNAGKNMKTKP
jgi:hypothetical protein